MSFSLVYALILILAVGYAVKRLAERYRAQGRKPSPALLAAAAAAALVVLAPPTQVLLYVAGAPGDIIPRLPAADWIMAIVWPWLAVHIFTDAPKGPRRWTGLGALWLGLAALVAGAHSVIAFDAARLITVLGFVLTLIAALRTGPGREDPTGG